VKKKVLICGASGFIGRNLAEYFAKSDEFEITGVFFKSEPPAIPGVEMVQADLRRSEDVDRLVKGKDILIQMAATTSGAKDIVARPYIHVTDNAVMNSLLFRAAYDHKLKHVIFPSCSIMYQPSDVPLKEDDFNIADDIHEKYNGAGWTKVYLEKIAKFFADRSDTKYSVFRHTNVYGPHDKYDLDKSHVFGATITKVMTNQTGTIDVYFFPAQRAISEIFVVLVLICVPIMLFVKPCSACFCPTYAGMPEFAHDHVEADAG